MTTDALFGELPDSSLIRRFLAGDERAFRVLYRRHTPRLRMIIRRLLGDQRDDADDVLQETWLAAARGMHAFKGDAQFSSWLATIGIRSTYRRLSLRQEATELFDTIAEPAREGPATVIDLERALGRLPDHQRAVVVLHDIEGFTHEEIADRIGIAVGTSKVTLSRARSALRRMLTEGALHA